MFTTSCKPMKYTTAVVYTFHSGVRHDPLISENQNKSFLFAFLRTRVWKLQKCIHKTLKSRQELVWTVIILSKNKVWTNSILDKFYFVKLFWTQRASTCIWQSYTQLLLIHQPSNGRPILTLQIIILYHTYSAPRL